MGEIDLSSSRSKQPSATAADGPPMTKIRSRVGSYYAHRGRGLWRWGAVLVATALAVVPMDARATVAGGASTGGGAGTFASAFGMSTPATAPRGHLSDSTSRGLEVRSNQGWCSLMGAGR